MSTPPSAGCPAPRRSRLLPSAVPHTPAEEGVGPVSTRAKIYTLPDVDAAVEAIFLSPSSEFSVYCGRHTFKSSQYTFLAVYVFGAQQYASTFAHFKALLLKGVQWLLDRQLGGDRSQVFMQTNGCARMGKSAFKSMDRSIKHAGE